MLQNMKIRTLMGAVVLTVFFGIGFALVAQALTVKLLTGSTSTAHHAAVAANEIADHVRVAQIDWLTEVKTFKDILIRGIDNDLRTRYKGEYLELDQKTDMELDKISDLATKGGWPDIAKKAQELKKQHHALFGQYSDGLATYDSLVKSADAADVEFAFLTVDGTVRGIDRPLTDAMSVFTDNIHAFSDKMQSEASSSLETMGTKLFLELLAICGTSGMATVFLIIIAMRSLMKQVGAEPRALQIAATRMSKGDLTVKVPVEKGDNSSLAAAIGVAVLSMKNIATGVTREAENIITMIDTSEDDNATLLSNVKESAGALKRAAGRFTVM